MNERTIIFVSDSTAITIESLGQTLLTQFPTIKFDFKIYPYVDSEEKAIKILQDIRAHLPNDALIFSSLVERPIREHFSNSEFICIDLFEQFLPKLSKHLESTPSPAVHQVHGMIDPDTYLDRIDAVEFTLKCDDGLGSKHYANADVILIGVSRSGKTPTCLYLALTYGIFAANYPFTEEDFTNQDLPESLKSVQNKIFGLLISPERLEQIRQSRRANSQYALLAQCQKEISYMEKLYKKFNIPYIDATHRSIEEISTLVITRMHLRG